MELNSEPKKAGDVLKEIILEEREFECPTHGKYTGRPIFTQWRNHEIDPPCPVCAKEESERLAIEEQKKQEEKRIADEAEKERKRIKWLTNLNIGKRLWDESFETFNAYNDELKHHLEICIEFAHNPQGRKLVMLGNNGTGKNHLAASILKITGGVVYKIFKIELLMKSSYSKRGSQEDDLIKQLCTTEMLVIDEIGRTKGGRWEENWLSYVIDERHQNFMPLILISNKHLKEDCPTGEGCPDCLQNWVGNDVLSRIIEDGLIMEFTGEDYRQKMRSVRLGEKK
jgi:DNA replication protein DnaC